MTFAYHPRFAQKLVSLYSKFLFNLREVTIMVTVVPAALKSADITRFAIRAAQVEKAKPPIAYWCMFRSLQMGLVVAKQIRQLLDRQSDPCEGIAHQRR